MLALCFFLTSCATGHQYYDVDQNGTRYYETITGEKIQVTVDGEIYGEDGQKLGMSQRLTKDWDLPGYEVQPSNSRCIDLFAWEESVPCWAYGVQIPVFFIGITAGAAVVGAYLIAGYYCGGGCYFSSADPPSYSRTQERSNKGPTRDKGGPGMQGAPSAGN